MANKNANKQVPATTGKAPAQPTKVKALAPTKYPIAASARSFKGLPKISMLATIATIGKHNGVGNRKKRFGLYKVGTSLLQANQATNGTSAIEIQYYATHANAGSATKLMVLKPCTPQAYKAFTAKWRAAKVAGKALPNKA